MNNYGNMEKMYYSKYNGHEKEFRDAVNIIKESPSSTKLNLWIKSKHGNKHQVFFQMLPQFMLISDKVHNFSHKQEIVSSQKIDYARNLLIEEVMATNRIEGINSTRGDIVSAEKTTEPLERFYSIVNKYKKLLSDEVIDIDSPTSIREIYDDLLLREVDESDLPDGELFRVGSVKVTDKNGHQREIHSGVMGEDNISTHLSQAIEVLNEESIPFLIRLSIFHYYLGYIHPFYDGNGRLARYITSALINHEVNDLLALKLSKIILENSNDYYNAFDTVNGGRNCGDLTPFIIMFMNVLDLSVDEIVLELKTYSVKLNKFQEYISSTYKELLEGTKKKYLDVSFIIFQSTLYGNQLSLKEIQEYINLSYSPTRRIVDFWIKEEVVIRTSRSDYNMSDALLGEIGIEI